MINPTLDWIDENAAIFTEAADNIWRLAETALEERRSAECLMNAAARCGFDVRAGWAGMDTAFKASWGSGRPVIGFLGEYDALPGFSQTASPHQEQAEGRRSGHACGHNLLGSASLAAAAAVRSAAEARGLPGTVVFWGCPAEETMTGKIFMARDGLFDELDAALSWHPGDRTEVLEDVWLALNSALFTFHGTQSHAALAPEEGRSALDAVELMNVGVNYLREHLPSDVRVHYAITDGGGKPNVVPARAQSLYYIRAADRATVESAFERVVKVARGAAMMTETEVDVELGNCCWNTLGNAALDELLHACLTEAGAPVWDDADRRFAGEMTGRPGDEALPQDILPLRRDGRIMYASTDVADVSWVAPIGQIMTCCAPAGTQWHTWQMEASAGSAIGRKGMIAAAKALALAGLRLMESPELLAAVRGDFERAKRGREYSSALPDGASPWMGERSAGERPRAEEQ